jgi:hypothetical protein
MVGKQYCFVWEMAFIHVGIKEIHVEMIAMDVIHPFDLNGFNTYSYDNI